MLRCTVSFLNTYIWFRTVVLWPCLLPQCPNNMHASILWKLKMAMSFFCELFEQNSFTMNSDLLELLNTFITLGAYSFIKACPCWIPSWNSVRLKSCLNLVFSKSVLFFLFLNDIPESELKNKAAILNWHFAQVEEYDNIIVRITLGGSNTFSSWRWNKVRTE